MFELQSRGYDQRRITIVAIRMKCPQSALTREERKKKKKEGVELSESISREQPQGWSILLPLFPDRD